MSCVRRTDCRLTITMDDKERNGEYMDNNGNDFLAGVRRCSFFVIIRVFDKYFKTKVDAKSIEGAEQIIEKTIAGFEYQIMNIYKANE